MGENPAVKYFHFNQQSTYVFLAQMNREVNLLTEIKRSRHLTHSEMASLGGFSKKQFSRLLSGEVKVQIEHVTGLTSILKMIYMGRLSEQSINNASYQLLCNLLPCDLKGLIKEKKKNTQNKPFKMKFQAHENLGSNEKYIGFYFLCGNGIKLTISAKTHASTTLSFRGRMAGDKGDTIIIGVGNFISFLNKGGKVRAFNKKLNITHSIYGIGSKCAKADSVVCDVYGITVSGIERYIELDSKGG